MRSGIQTVALATKKCIRDNRDRCKDEKDIFGFDRYDSVDLFHGGRINGLGGWR